MHVIVMLELRISSFDALLHISAMIVLLCIFVLQCYFAKNKGRYRIIARDCLIEQLLVILELGFG